jgi:hypothetical protein
MSGDLLLPAKHLLFAVRMQPLHSTAHFRTISTLARCPCSHQRTWCQVLAGMSPGDDRFLVALPSVRDLLSSAKHLFVRRHRGGCLPWVEDEP